MSHTLRRAHVQYDRLIVLIELALLCVLFGTYIYFITMTVVHGVARTDVKREIQELEMAVNELEANYLAEIDTLSPEVLKEYKLVATLPRAYVELAPEDDRLSRRE